MKKILLLVLTAAFAAAPLLACDGMNGYKKSDLKAGAAPAHSSKHAKAKTKTSKPLAAAPAADQKL